MPTLLLLSALAATASPAGHRPAGAERSPSVYELVPALDVPIIAISVVAGTLPYLLADWIVEPSCPCDPASVNRFDRFAIGFENGSIGALSTVALAASVLIPATLDAKLLGFTPALLEDLTVLLEALAISGTLSVLAKFSVQRPVPLVYAGHPELVPSPSGYRAFYSGHTTLAATALSVMAMTVSRRYGFQVWPWVVTGVVSGAVGVGRVASGLHYPSDVIVGLLTGVGVGILVPALHMRTDGEPERVSISVSPGGAGLVLRLP